MLTKKSSYYNFLSMNHILQVLYKIGLSQKESDVLLALLSVQKITVAELARQTNIPRTTIYTALQKLMKKKLILRVKVGKRELWEAVNPQRILKMKQEQVLQLKTILPDLEQLIRSIPATEKSTVVQYKGTQGLQKVYDMILEVGKGERVYTFEGGRSSEKKMTILPQEYSRFWQDAVKRKKIILESVVSEKILTVIHNASPEMLKAAQGRASITYILPDEVMNFYSDIVVFGQCVAIITPKDRVAVVITDSVTALAFRHLLKIACAMGRKMDLNAF